MGRVSRLLSVLLGLAFLPGEAGANPSGSKLNRCGCYRDEVGICMCLRKSRCGCPGECEPVGCEEERQKDLARRMEEELRKIRDDEAARGRGRNDDKTASDEKEDAQDSTHVTSPPKPSKRRPE